MMSRRRRRASSQPDPVSDPVSSGVSGRSQVGSDVESGGGHVRHLVRRWWGMMRAGPVPVRDEIWAESWLSPTEVDLWRRLGDADRHHAILVARRFRERRPSADRSEMSAALLHDIGKVHLGWGPGRRVLATLAGARRRGPYHDHEARGAAMLAEIGSDPLTVALVDPHRCQLGSDEGPGAEPDAVDRRRFCEARGALRWADDI